MKPVRNILVLLALVLAGCSTPAPVQYVSPRVEGRVLDGQSRRPLAGVIVHRAAPNLESTAYQPVHGGEVMAQVPSVRSGPDGGFVLKSERDLALLRRLGWYSVSIVFEHQGYERFTASYTLTNAIRSAKGEPVVLAGDILLQPAIK